jgi:hypothetical protein
MSSYEPVKKAMAAGTPLELICASCPWDRLCVQPPTMTSAEVEQLIAAADAKDRARDPNGLPAGLMMTTVMLAGKDGCGAMCPVFSARLRSDRQVADGIRNAMRGYGEAS